MNFDSKNRRWHSRIAVIVAIPFLFIIVTGVLLQVKKQWAWVQPKELTGTSNTPMVGLDVMLAELKANPELRVTGWSDIARCEIRPSTGIVKFKLTEDREAQLDLGTGRILQVAVRRSDFLESIHDGSFFAGNWTKLGLFLPVGVLVFLLWASGIRLLLLPWIMRRRRAR